MNYKIIIPIILVISIATYFIYKSKAHKPVGIMTEWDQKINSAELNEELFNKANDEEKEDLIYYFTQKIRREDNYGKSSFEKMPKILKVAYLINVLEAEVNNGGFLQFFTNSSGQYTNETIESLEMIGANYTKGLLENAVGIMLKHNESTDSLNGKINSRKLYEIFETSEIYDNESMMKEMNKLDMKFYDYHDSLPTLKIDFLEKNQNVLWVELKEKYGS